MPRQDLAEQGDATRAKITSFIQSYIAQNGVSPALTEIAAGVGLASHNAVRNHLLQLQSAGKVTWQPGKFRTLRVVEASRDTTVRKSRAKTGAARR